jgi:AcrR family transcriptional regulator
MAQTTTTQADPLREKRLTAKGQRTVATLTAAARRVFERDGFLHARVTDIAEEAGVAHGTFYSYFDSKEEVFRKVVLELMEDVVEQARAPRDGSRIPAYDSIRAANRSYVLVFRENARLMLAWAHVATSSPVLAELLQQQKDAFVSRAERGIRRLQEQGLADREIDARYAAKALGSMVNEFCAQWFGRDLDFELETAVETLSLIWARAIGLNVPPADA